MRFVEGDTASLNDDGAGTLNGLVIYCIVVPFPLTIVGALVMASVGACRMARLSGNGGEYGGCVCIVVN